MRLDSAAPAISRVLFRWSHSSGNVLHNPPVRVSISLEREVKRPRRREQLTRPKAPPQDIVQWLAPKRGVMSITFTAHFVL
jgi:hypothetical protein